jgi:DNA polymerase-4
MLPATQLPGAASPAGRVIAHVDLDAFFASVEQLLEPRLRGKPVVVGGRANERGVVASASYEARARGIRVPMPLTRAYRICPEAHFLPGRYDQYRDFSHRVFTICERFSPTLEQASIDEGYLDWTVEQWRARHPHAPVPRHWPLELAEALRAAVAAETGLSVSVGIGSNRLIAKIANKYAKPRAICHVATGGEAAFLRPLPLKIVPGIGPRAAELLAASGYHVFAQVQDASDAELEARLGTEGAQRLRALARGEGRDVLTPHTLPVSVSNETTFRENTSDPEQVRRTLYRLVEKAAWRLRRAGLRAGTCTVKLRTADFVTRNRGRSLSFRTDSHLELYAVAAPLLDDLFVPHRPVRLVGVQLSNLDASSNRQLLLFDDAPPSALRRVDQALDAVRSRFGFSIIRTAGAMEPAGRA